MNTTPLYEFECKLRECIIRTHLGSDLNAAVIGKLGGGFGDVYLLKRAENSFPQFLVAKCPKIEKFNSREEANSKLEDMLREAEKTHSLFHCPWVNPVTKICLVHGWPFLISQRRHGTLSDLISRPSSWRLVDRISSLLQIIRVLRMAAECGISAHQDLKPENIFFDDQHQKFIGVNNSPGFRFQMYVGDFGLADAFCERRHNFGTLGYMAPEQFEDKNLESTAGVAIDIFAVGVIAYMCFCDGIHPVYEATSGVWTQKGGISGKGENWDMWRHWANQEDRDLDLLKKNCPPSLSPMISAALAADSKKRPSPEAFEAALWETLEIIDADTYAYEDIQIRVKGMESMNAGNRWPHFEDRLASLRKFYESL